MAERPSVAHHDPVSIMEDVCAPREQHGPLARHVLTGAAYGALVAGLALIPLSFVVAADNLRSDQWGALIWMMLISLPWLCLGLWQLSPSAWLKNPHWFGVGVFYLFLGAVMLSGLGFTMWLFSGRTYSQAFVSLLVAVLSLALGGVALGLARVRDGKGAGTVLLPSRATQVLAAGMAAVLVLVVMISAPRMLTPLLARDKLVSNTATAPATVATYPSVTRIAASTSSRSAGAPQEAVWQVSLLPSVKEVVSGSRGPILVTERGLYGLEAADGSVAWSLATAALDAKDDLGLDLVLVPLYGDRLAFTSPDGARMVFAYRASERDSPESRIRVLVVSTDTGTVDLDQEVPGNHPTVQLTDSLALIDRHVYDLTSGKELTALQEMYTPVPGPGGHTTALVRFNVRYPNDPGLDTASLETFPELELRQATSPLAAGNGPDLESALTKRDQVLTSGGWVVIRSSKDNVMTYNAQNIDTGELVSLGSGELAAVSVSPQAIVAWTATTPDDPQLAASHLYPASLTIRDVRDGTTTQPALATVVSDLRSGVHSRDDTGLASSVTGVVDWSVFDLNLMDWGLSDARLVLPMTDAGAAEVHGVRDADGTALPWMKVDPDNLVGWSSFDESTVCSGGIVVTVNALTDDHTTQVSAWRVGG